MAVRKTESVSTGGKGATHSAAKKLSLENANEIARMESEGGAQSPPDIAAPDYREPAADTSSAKPALPANEARQGVTGHGVSSVLAFSLAGAAVVFLVLYFWVY